MNGIGPVDTSVGGVRSEHIGQALALDSGVEFEPIVFGGQLLKDHSKVEVGGRGISIGLQVCLTDRD